MGGFEYERSAWMSEGQIRHFSMEGEKERGGRWSRGLTERHVFNHSSRQRQAGRYIRKTNIKKKAVAERPSSPPIGFFLDLLTRGAPQFVELHAPEIIALDGFCFGRGPSARIFVKAPQRRQKGK